jgi:hypothetical protein
MQNKKLPTDYVRLFKPEDLENISIFLEAVYLISQAIESLNEYDLGDSKFRDLLEQSNLVLQGHAMSENNTKALVALEFSAMLTWARVSDYRKKGDQKTTIKSKVYFLLDEESNLLKIGRTLDVTSRRRTLETMSGRKLTLIGSIKGGAEMESYFHRMYKPYRCEGEWFRLPSEFIEDIKKGVRVTKPRKQ